MLKRSALTLSQAAGRADRLGEFYKRFYSAVAAQLSQAGDEAAQPRNQSPRQLHSNRLSERPLRPKGPPDDSVQAKRQYPSIAPWHVPDELPKDAQGRSTFASNPLSKWMTRALFKHEAYFTALKTAITIEQKRGWRADKGRIKVLREYLKTVNEQEGLAEKLLTNILAKKAISPEMLDTVEIDNLGNLRTPSAYWLNQLLLNLLRRRPVIPHVILRVCFALLATNATPDKATFNILINGLTRLRKTAMAHSVFKQMSDLHIEPDSYTIVALLNLMIRSGDREGFFQTKKIVRKSFLALVHDLPSEEERIKAAARLTEKDMEGKKWIFDTLIMGHLIFNEPSMAMAYLHLRAKELPGIPINVPLQTAFLRYFAETRDYRRGMNLWESMMRHHGDDLDIRAYYWLLRVAKRAGRKEVFERHLQEAVSRGFDEKQLRFGLKKDKGLPLRRKNKNLFHPPGPTDKWHYEPDPEREADQSQMVITEADRLILRFIGDSDIWPAVPNSENSAPPTWRKVESSAEEKLPDVPDPLEGKIWDRLLRLRVQKLPTAVREEAKKLGLELQHSVRTEDGTKIRSVYN